MDPPRSRERDESDAPPSGRRNRETPIAALYAEHWPYVLAVLPSYGVSAQDAEDVAQTAWLHGARRATTGGPSTKGDGPTRTRRRSFERSQLHRTARQRSSSALRSRCCFAPSMS